MREDDKRENINIKGDIIRKKNNIYNETINISKVLDI